MTGASSLQTAMGGARCKNHGKKPFLVVEERDGSFWEISCLKKVRSMADHANFCVAEREGWLKRLYDLAEELASTPEVRFAGASNRSINRVQWSRNTNGAIVVPYTQRHKLKPALGPMFAQLVEMTSRSDGTRTGGSGGAKRINADPSWLPLVLLAAELDVKLPQELMGGLQKNLDALADDTHANFGPLEVAFPQEFLAALRRMAVESEYLKVNFSDAVNKVKKHVDEKLEAPRLCCCTAPPPTHAQTAIPPLYVMSLT